MRKVYGARNVQRAYIGTAYSDVQVRDAQILKTMARNIVLDIKTGGNPDEVLVTLEATPRLGKRKKLIELLQKRGWINGGTK